MSGQGRRHVLALGLSLALALTYLWCVLDNVANSAQEGELGVTVPLTAATLASALLWLSGHAIHGTLVLALPAWYVRSRLPPR